MKQRDFIVLRTGELASFVCGVHSVYLACKFAVLILLNFESVIALFYLLIYLVEPDSS